VSKRLAFLEKTTAAGTKDPFPWYALALEYASLGRIDDALATFTKLRELDRTYVPMYFQAGTMLVKAARAAEGRSWLEGGVAAAKAKGDTHALSELESALAELG
jgi:hypothetical protein